MFSMTKRDKEQNQTLLLPQINLTFNLAVYT
jgi:hypothetical protein